MSDLKSKRAEDLAAFLIIVVFYGGMQLVGITCPIKFLTGISCPGCGMTRAWLSLIFRQDLSAAFGYHPLFWLVIPAVPLFLLRRRLPARLRSVLLAAVCTLMFGVYFWRMLMTDSTVVVFAPQDGFIWRIICRLWTSIH